MTLYANMSSYDDKKEVDHGDDLVQKEVVHDHDVLGQNDVTREDAMHMGQLTPEELELERKLRKKIDLMIMPLIMTVRSFPTLDNNLDGSNKVRRSI